MKIVCIGAGPGGLYFAISAKLRDAGHDITVIERDPPGATYGWGVVYWEDLLDTLYRNDREGARRIRAESTLWQEQVVSLRGTDRMSAATSSTGTAYVGTTRLGSQTSIARVVSMTVPSPTSARMRLSIGS